MSASGSLPATVHGGQLRQLAARFGVAAEQLLDFSANINPAGPPRSSLAAIQRSLDDPATLESYPDLELSELRKTISDCLGIAPESVAIANGFAPLLDAALRSFEVKRCLLPVPSFSEYRRSLENSGVDVVPYALSPDKAFAYEIAPIQQAIRDHSCDAILLANPQNPSGVLCDAVKMQQLIEVTSRCGATVLLDEAFIDFCPDASLTQYAVERPNVIAFRSITKFFAIPGLRVAYAAAALSRIAVLNRHIAPWPIAGIASVAACAALNERAYAEESRLANSRRRSWLEERLKQMRITTYPSSTNFLLLRFPADVDVSVLWERMIVDERIVLRNCEGFEQLTAGHLRIAVRSDAENERLIRGLERVFSFLM
jgi:threonine-phosphate decarboxylase